MASKTSQEAVSTEAVEELLDALDKTLDRLKTLYEQYFLGIQKQAPQFIHSDVERKLRDLTQLQIRNTGLRYRLATLQQKFGAYNSYWRRTLRQIENGTYLRNLSKVGRQAAQTGAEIPEEILAAMPKRMREQVLRDREVALAAAARRKQQDEDTQENAPVAYDAVAAMDAEIGEPGETPRGLRAASDGAFHLKADDEFDIDAFFKEVESGDDGAGAGAGAGASGRASGSPRAMPKTVPPLNWGEPSAKAGAGPAAPSAGAPATGASGRGTRVTQTTPPAAQAAVVPGALPRMPTAPLPRMPTAPSQAVKPNPIAPGASQQTPNVRVESMNGPFPRMPTTPSAGIPTAGVPTSSSGVPTSSSGVPTSSSGVPTGPSGRTTGPVPTIPSARQTGPVPRVPTSPSAPPPPPGARTTQAVPRVGQTQPIPKPGQTQPIATNAGQRPPPGMTDADVNALYQKYVKAKEMLGEQVGPAGRDKLLKTINAQAPKIMEQYNAKAVDFSVVVKDNQVIIRAKPKT